MKFTDSLQLQHISSPMLELLHYCRIRLMLIALFQLCHSGSPAYHPWSPDAHLQSSAIILPAQLCTPTIALSHSQCVSGLCCSLWLLMELRARCCYPTFLVQIGTGPRISYIAQQVCSLCIILSHWLILCSYCWTTPLRTVLGVYEIYHTPCVPTTHPKPSVWHEIRAMAFD